MIALQRQQALRDEVARHGLVRLRDLCQRLGVSIASLRRDAVELEARGSVIRVHGGVMHPSHLREPSLAQRQNRARAAKQAIARAAASLVQPGQTVFIDAGSTCLLVGRLLATRADVTIITNSLALAHAVCGGPATLLVVGGRARWVSGALVGGDALAAMNKLSAQWAFIGASGLTQEGLSTPELEEAAVKQTWLRRARAAVVVADIGKWGSPQAVRFADWSEVHHWIVDAPPPSSARRCLRDHCVKVRIASPTK